MKNKVTILKNTPSYTKADIAENMDFDALLEKGVPQPSIQSRIGKHKWKLFGVLTLMVVGI